jgi:cytochrome c oxidase subunit 2
MRAKLQDPEFNYVLLCNKVCGSAHYNMQMSIIVDTEEDYQLWLAQQKTFVEAPVESAPADSTVAPADSTLVPADSTLVPGGVDVIEDESKVAVK